MRASVPLGLLLVLAGCAASTPAVRGDARGGPGAPTSSAPHAWAYRCATDCLGCTAEQRADYERTEGNCPQPLDPAR